ncbi:hypothetical protein PsorP6_004851 [Peronosclerospora sorghi]|uniref:Uncharacterized protein n=1 Tax=Peronosclerospora sorghi TaxID=230839 RepID=A0ACC0W5N2_9STRA|nr:hypothetical protein PsorP6_004851 [Peronosclerospora sorghi]
MRSADGWLYETLTADVVGFLLNQDDVALEDEKSSRAYPARMVTMCHSVVGRGYIRKEEASIEDPRFTVAVMPRMSARRNSHDTKDASHPIQRSTRGHSSTSRVEFTDSTKTLHRN